MMGHRGVNWGIVNFLHQTLMIIGIHALHLSHSPTSLRKKTLNDCQNTSKQRSGGPS